MALPSTTKLPVETQLVLPTRARGLWSDAWRTLARNRMALLGLGLRTLSMSPGRIGPIRMMIRSMHLGEVSAFVDRLCGRVDHSLRTRLFAFAAERGIVLK